MFNNASYYLLFFSVYSNIDFCWRESRSFILHDSDANIFVVPPLPEYEEDLLFHLAL